MLNPQAPAPEKKSRGLAGLSFLLGMVSIITFASAQGEFAPLIAGGVFAASSVVSYAAHRLVNLRNSAVGNLGEQRDSNQQRQQENQFELQQQIAMEEGRDNDSLSDNEDQTQPPEYREEEMPYPVLDGSVPPPAYSNSNITLGTPRANPLDRITHETHI